MRNLENCVFHNIGLRIAICLIIATVVSACGGGGSENSPLPIQDTSDMSDQGPVIQMPNSNSSEVDPSDTDDLVIVSDTGATGNEPAEPIESADNSESSVAPEDSLIQGGLAEGVIVAAEDGQAPGISGEAISRLRNSVLVTDNGSVLFAGALDFGNSDEVLWGGTIEEPQLLLRTGMAIEGFPPSVRLESFNDREKHLSRDGSASVLATLGGARSVNAVLRSSESGMVPVFRSDEPLSVEEQNLSFDSFRRVRHYGQNVAVVATQSFDELALMLSSNGTYHYIAPGGTFTDQRNSGRIFLAPLQSDGCRITFRSISSGTQDSANFAVRIDGSVVFEGHVRVEAGAEQNVAVCPDRARTITNSRSVRDQTAGGSGFFETIASYRSGEYQRIVSVGDPVPGMANTVFTAVSLVRVLDDGSILVSAELNDFTVERRERMSLWIFSESNQPRLVMLDGEMAESSVLNDVYTFSVSSPDRFGAFDGVDVLDDGSSLAVVTFENSNGDFSTWINSGKAHPGQPYVDLESVGSSPLQPVLGTGYPAPPNEFAESAFWSSIGRAQLLTEGGGIFAASISDPAPGAEVASTAGLWRFNDNNEVSRALPSEVTFTVDEIPRTVSIPLDRWQLVGSTGILFVDSVANDERIVFIPF